MRCMRGRRIQISLAAEQWRRLDERRRREKRTLSDLVGEALNAYLVDRADAAVILDSTFGALPRLEALNRDFWDRV